MCMRQSRQTLLRKVSTTHESVHHPALQLTKINDELDDLEPSHPLLPPDTDATRSLEVVPVHDNVHTKVQSDGNPRDRGGADELGVAEKGGSTMVVAVQEGYNELASFH
jgi:hypothetical protein